MVLELALLLANRLLTVDSDDSTLHMASVLLAIVDNGFVSERKSNCKIFYQNHKLFHWSDQTENENNFL